MSGVHVRPLLTIAQRSCLLRAARERLAQLHEDYDAAVTLVQEPGPRRETLAIEVACITGAIAWLWLQPTSD